MGRVRSINSQQAPSPVGGYSQALEIKNANRWLFISGQVPENSQGETPSDFKAQCELVWSNINAQLEAANMSVNNLVKVTTFLSSREYALENREVRAQALGDNNPAMTVIITGIFDEKWLLEIEAIAAD